MIAAAIRKADNAYTIYFLLSVYIEFLCFKQTSASLPPDVVRLPLRSRGDVTSRFITLIDALMP